MLKKRNQFISNLLTLLIFLGMSFSVVHLHGNSIGAFELQQEIVQDHNFCAVCASLHKAIPDSEVTTEIFTFSEIYWFIQPLRFFASPEVNLQNERAPPFIA